MNGGAWVTPEALARASYEDACRDFADTPEKLARVQAGTDLATFDPGHRRKLLARASWVLERAAELSGPAPAAPAPQPAPPPRRRAVPAPDDGQGVLL